jgi:hypothetical protein
MSGKLSWMKKSWREVKKKSAELCMSDVIVKDSGGNSEEKFFY